MPINSQRLDSWRENTSPFIRGALFYSLYWGTIGIIDPYLNVYFTRMGVTGTQIGVILSLFPLMALVTAPSISSLADKRAWRVWMLAACCFGLSLAYFGLGFANQFWNILLGYFFLAILKSPVASLGDSLIIRMGIHYGLDFGKMRLWGSIIFAVTTALTGYLWQVIGLRWMFPFASVLFLIVVFSALLMEESAPVTHHASNPWKLLIRNKEILILFIATILFGGSLQLGYAFSGMYLARLGGAESMIGMMACLSGLGEAPLMYYGAALMRRMGGLRALLLGYGLLGLGFALCIFAWAPWVMLLTGAIRGTGFGLAFIATVVTFDQHAPDNWSATIQAMVNAVAFGLAPFIFSFVGGIIYDIWPGGVFALGTILILLAMAALILAKHWESNNDAVKVIQPVV